MKPRISPPPCSHGSCRGLLTVLFLVLLCAAAILVTGFLPQDIFAPGETAIDLLAGARSAADSLLR